MKLAFKRRRIGSAPAPISAIFCSDSRSPRCACLVLTIFFLLCVSTLLTGPATAAGLQPQLRATDAWVRAMPPGSSVAAGYLTLHNAGIKDLRVVSFTSSFAKSVEVHEMSMAGGQMRMRQVKGGLVVPSQQTVRLSPGGYHLMFMQVTGTLAADGTVPLSLGLADGSIVTVSLPIAESLESLPHGH